MSDSESKDSSVREVVSVSKHGQATIPKQFREQLDLDAPGEVSFRKTDDGDVVVERVPSAEEMIGFASRASSGEESDKSATELLREKRVADKRDRDARFNESDE